MNRPYWIDDLRAVLLEDITGVSRDDSETTIFLRGGNAMLLTTTLEQHEKLMDTWSRIFEESAMTMAPQRQLAADNIEVGIDALCGVGVDVATAQRIALLWSDGTEAGKDTAAIIMQAKAPIRLDIDSIDAAKVFLMGVFNPEEQG